MLLPQACCNAFINRSNGAMPEQLAYLQDLLALWGRINAKRIFGGYGIYRDGCMFALLFKSALYLKVDSNSQSRFDAHALPAFTYERAGKQIALSYRLAPDAFWDEPATATEWSQRSWEAAIRSLPQKKPRRQI